MKFQDFIESGKVRKRNPDIQLAKTLAKMSGNNLAILRSMEIIDTNASFMMSAYYDALRQLLEAMAVEKGYKIYSHEAYTYFLKNVLNEDTASIKFDRFRKIRNKINYYGKPVDKETVKSCKGDVIKLVDYLKKKFKPA